MIANCKGCIEEFDMAYILQQQGFHIATGVGRDLIRKGHLFLIVVDEDGKVVIE